MRICVRPASVLGSPYGRDLLSRKRQDDDGFGRDRTESQSGETGGSRNIAAALPRKQILEEMIREYLANFGASIDEIESMAFLKPEEVP